MLRRRARSPSSCQDCNRGMQRRKGRGQASPHTAPRAFGHPSKYRHSHVQWYKLHCYEVPAAKECVASARASRVGPYCGELYLLADVLVMRT
jgi:hypothetical protein